MLHVYINETLIIYYNLDNLVCPSQAFKLLEKLLKIKIDQTGLKMS